MADDRAVDDSAAQSALMSGLRAYLDGDLAEADRDADTAVGSQDLRAIAHYLKALVALERGEETAARIELAASSEDEALAASARRVLAGLDVPQRDVAPGDRLPHDVPAGDSS